MPRARRSKKGPSSRGSRQGTRVDSDASDDEASDVLSHCSDASETVSVLEEGSGSDAPDLQSYQEQREDKLKENIDNLLDRSAKTRLTALGNVRLALSSQVFGDFLLERRVTLTDALERCLKKGKEEEQSLAAALLSLLCIQLGCGSEGEEVFHSVKNLLISVLTDSSAGASARQSCATALGICCYIAATDEDLASSLNCLEGIFTLLCSENSGIPANLQGLACCAIQSWALLLTICPASRIQKALESHLPYFSGVLSSENVSLRIAGGESLALLYELGRDLEEDFEYDDVDTLCVALKALATDSNKYRAKTDRRKQRSIFRDVLHYIEGGEECHEETIKFGLEVMYVDSWVRRRTYSTFKETLGSGIHFHLQHNEVLRDIFSLGAPLILDAAAIKASKISRVEKHMFNSAAFKARTKAMSRVRDKRADVL